MSEFLPVVNRRTHEIFKAAHNAYRVDYILGRYFRHQLGKDSALWKARKGLASFALRFALCSKDVLELLLARVSDDAFLQQQLESCPLIPRRLFSNLAPKSRSERPWSVSDEPLPFLRYLSDISRFDRISFNVYGGYPLSRATHADHIPLMKFLLSKGASPEEKDALAVRIAIRKRDLTLIQLLIERNEELEGTESDRVGKTSKGKSGKNKRRRLEDRMVVSTALLKLAVEVDARDIVDYFMDKGARPDMKTLQIMVNRGIM